MALRLYIAVADAPNLLSLDYECLTAVAWAQRLVPGQYELFKVSDASISKDGELDTLCLLAAEGSLTFMANV